MDAHHQHDLTDKAYAEKCEEVEELPLTPKAIREDRDHWQERIDKLGGLAGFTHVGIRFV